MITSLIKRKVTVTPTDLAKEIIALYGRNGLARVRSILKENEIAVTERELATVYKHCITIHNRVCKVCSLELIEPNVLETIYPLEAA
ncbi:hypothetical protein AB6G46_24230 [Providencia hangzhouensis]|uniref:hypothetical protein n=1 Tax=Providencia TaxID=586 RepID=UPI00109BFA6B|nr:MULTISPECIES: hypothetical protein [unclassified Providencia]THB27333.1 hypothetical protein E6R27_08805 [Providencia sp. MGF014]